MKVMIAVDGSTGSFAAVDQIGRVLGSDTDEVALYCSPPEIRARKQHPDASVLARAQRGYADAVFEEARKRLPDGLQETVHTIVDTRDPRQGVALEAEAWAADVVAVGARGLSTLERLLLGSVSRAIVHHSKIPVWVARQAAGEPRRTPNVLLACENPELGKAAAELLAKFSWPNRSRFATISVVESIFAGRVPDWLEHQARSPEVEAMVQAWAKEHEEDLQACRDCMEEFTRAMPPPLNQCRTLVVEGEPASEILAAIQAEKIDLAVIGSQHKRTFASMILGSTSEAVLNHATCSVLVVPQHKEM